MEDIERKYSTPLAVASNTSGSGSLNGDDDDYYEKR